MEKTLLFICIGLIFTVLSGCVKEEMGLIYVADYVNSRIMILDEDMNYVDQFSVPNYPYCVAADEDYIYMNTYAADKGVYKYNRQSPYGLVASDAGPRAGEDMDEQGEYLYLADETADEHLHILKKSDCTLHIKINMEDWNHCAEGVAADENYIYVSCWNGKLRKYDISSLAKVADVASLHYGRAWIDDQYVYLAREGSGHRIDIYQKSDLSFVKWISTGGTGGVAYNYHIVTSGDYAYVTDGSDHVVRKIQISTDTVVATFGEEGVEGSDESHLDSPGDIAMPPEEAQEVFGGYIG